MFRVSCRLLTMCLLTSPLVAQTRSRLPADQTSKIEQVISQEMAKRKIPAMSVTIAIKNQIRYSNGFGIADLENFVPATPQTRYRTASIAKPMTAVAVMMLAEEGKIDLDKSIEHYCPQYPKKRWPITCRSTTRAFGRRAALQSAGGIHRNSPFPDSAKVTRPVQG